MLTGLDHIGVVARTWDEATGVLVDQLGLEVDLDRTPLPDGTYFAPEGTHNYFIKVGLGATRIEILIPAKPGTGTWRFLEKKGPGLHHLGYASTDVAADTKILRERGLSQIDLGEDPERLSASFFHPKTVNGILTELVPDRGLHAPR